MPTHDRFTELQITGLSARVGGRFGGLILVATAVLCVCFGAIDAQRFWLDELGTWRIANVRGLDRWISEYLAIENSDGQLPFYHFLVYLWTRLFGLGEQAIRSLNGVFLAAAVFAIAVERTLPVRTRTAWTALLCASCFTWTYLNEARPYIMLMLGATWLTLSLLRAAPNETRRHDLKATVSWLLLGALFSFAASPIATPFIGCVLVGALVLAGSTSFDDLVSALRHRLPLLGACLIVGGVVAGLVGYSILKGATPELRNSSSVGSVLFGLVEVVGGGGLVPGRHQLRVNALGALAAWQWVMLTALGGCAILMTLSALRSRFKVLVIALLAIMAFAASAVVLAGFLMGFRIVGRHFAFMVPPLLLILAIGITEARSGLMRFSAVGLAAMLVVSTLLFRTADQHGKDQTDAVAEVARQVSARGGTIWWVGAPLLPEYFGFTTRSIQEAEGTSGSVVQAARNESWQSSARDAPRPDLIIVERPEAADPNGFFALQAQAAGMNTSRQLRGYTVYERRM